MQSNSWLARVITLENFVTWTGVAVAGAFAWANLTNRVAAVEQADKVQIAQIDGLEKKLDSTSSTVIRLDANVGAIKEDVNWIRNKLDK